MIEKVTLTSGMEFPCRYITEYHDKELFINIRSEEVSAIMAFFTNPEETLRIAWMGNVYEGFTEFSTITKIPNGYRVILTKL